MTESLQDDELVLSVWAGDENALGEIVMRHAGALQLMIRKKFPCLSEHDAEDVVCEAIRRFWLKREGFDGTRSLRGYIYGFVQRVAQEHTSGKLAWQQSQKLEVQSEDLDGYISHQEAADDEARLHSVEQKQTKLLAAIKQVYDELPPYEQDLWYAFAFGGTLVTASDVGYQLGQKHKGGVAVPQGTIRVQKNRLTDKIVKRMSDLGFSPANLEKKR